MKLRQAGWSAMFVLGLTVSATAQDTPAPVGTNGTNTPPAVDVSKLPIDMARIRRELARATVREERHGLNLRYIVDVFGQAPAIDLFSSPTDPNFWTGPAPYGAPTHRDMLYMITPQEHRAPAADFGALFRWLADKSTGEKNPRK